jgi:transcription elongation factor Elf1
MFSVDTKARTPYLWGCCRCMPTLNGGTTISGLKKEILAHKVYFSRITFHLSPHQVTHMCPVKKSFRTPHNRIKILTKDAKQMVNGPYFCPQCKKELMQILADPAKKQVFCICKCGLEHQLTYAPVFQPIDYYSKFMDYWKRHRYVVPPKQPRPNPTKPADEATPLSA